ncbi:universal stress protein [Peptoniphilus sp. GNH]|nr:universal stress family protein [Clostridiales bacterium KA00134]UHR02448.1 universal stress protein [Peptoniphilus sp. GNH]
MKILVPVDGSSSSKQCVKVARELGEKLMAKIYLLTVIPEAQFFDQHPSSFPYSLEIEKANTERAEFVLSEVEKELDGYKNEHEIFYTSGNPASKIIEFAEKNQVDMIIMGNRGLGAFSRTLLGSVSNKVINTAKCNVLVVKRDSIQ